jgi:NAD(P)-dependent dehydrogenase (short-subunit alcohol dehydrogenase family)
MTVDATQHPIHGHTDLQGPTVVVIGGSSGIGLATARAARAAGAEVILAPRE